MKQLIFLKNYNNYFNRTIFANKKIYEEQIIHKLNNPSFNVNDGIRASQIVNADVSKCDYAIFCEDTSLIENTEKQLVEEEVTEIELNKEYLFKPNATTIIKATNTFITSSNDNVFNKYTDDTFTEIEETINFSEMEVIFSTNNPSTINLYQIEDGETVLKATFTTKGTKYLTFKFVKAPATIGTLIEVLNGYLKEISYYKIDNPDSRWFILECIKQRTGQYLLNLKRDVLADNLTSILESPMFIEKGTLDNSDLMIYNDEGMTLNKIKTEESLIKGNTYGKLNSSSVYDRQSAWIVGYVTKQELRKLDDKGEVGTDILDSITVSPYKGTDNYPSISEIATQTGISENRLTSILNSKEFEIITKDFNINFGVARNGMFTRKGQITYNGLGDSISNAQYNDSEFWTNELFTTSKAADYIAGQITNIFRLANYNGYYEDIRLIFENNEGKSVLTKEEYQALQNIEGIYYNDTNYNLSFSQLTDTANKDITTILSDTNNAKLKSALSNTRDVTWINDNGEVWFNINKFATVTVRMVTAVSTGFTIPFLSATKRPDCANSPCDIFVIPFNNVWFKGPETGSSTVEQNVYYTNLSINDVLKIASEIALKLGSQLYDIQLVPFVDLPVTTGFSGSLSFNNIIDVKGNIDTKASYITSASYPLSFIYWLSSPSFTINSNEYIPESVKTITEPKIQSQTQMCRIVSPTGQGMFDFNPAKNGGFKSYRINCTLKPYSPYIQILPIFNNMYGQDFNDYRGLICSGDFSLSRVQNAWIEYQLQNKNYQNIFNREMENLDFNQRQEAKYQPLSVATGAISGGISGAVAGGVAGGPWGALAGGVVGTGSSLAGGIVDLQLAGQKRAETKDYARDRFSYQLGNIKAIPNSITKVGTFVINSKIFPFIEVYDCTEVEKQALRDKIKYDGMTVNRIGHLGQFMGGDDNQQFVKGQMIRLNDLSEDSHIANEIYDELLKGVYI